MTAAAFAVLSLIAALVYPPPASAGGQRSTLPSVSRDPQEWTSGGGWHLRLGAAQRDTLDASPRVALVAARIALANDEWELEPSPASSLELTTRWKSIHNIIFRLFSGSAYYRCFVSIRTLSEETVEVTFQGGVATRRDIEHKPVSGPASRSYVSAARVWLREVRELAENLQEVVPQRTASNP